MIKRLIALLLVTLTTGQIVSAAQPATVVRDTPLYAEPFTDAIQLGQLSPDTEINILKRKGGWYRIQAATATGWVRLTTLRLKAATSVNSNSNDSSVLDNLGSGSLFSSGRASNSEVTAATGIRGLDDESVAANPAARKGLVEQLLNRYAVTPAQASEFARKGQLQAHAVNNPDKIEVEPPPPPGKAKQAPDSHSDSTTDDLDDF